MPKMDPVHRIQAKYKRLSMLAFKSLMLKDKLEAEIEKMKARPRSWRKFCEINGIDEGSDVNDWMC